MDRLLELQRTEGNLLLVDIVVCCHRSKYEFFKEYDIYPCQDSLWKGTPEFKPPDINEYLIRLKDSIGKVISSNELRSMLEK